MLNDDCYVAIRHSGLIASSRRNLILACGVFGWAVSGVGGGANAPGGERCDPTTAPRVNIHGIVEICRTVRANDPARHRCERDHAGGAHFLTGRTAEVRLVSPTQVHVVESCGSHDSHEATGDDDYVLWYVCGLPAAGSYGPTCPSPALPTNPYPYVPPASDSEIPNPNNPDPAGRYDIVTRHWAASPVPYWVNVPAGLATTPIFDPSYFFASPWCNTYTYGVWQQDIINLMASVATIPGAEIAPTYSGTTSVDWNLAIPPGGTALPMMGGNLVWHTNCGGPTGDGRNEVIFIRSGAAIESDIIYETGDLSNYGTFWGSQRGPKYSTGLAHEIGHFFGLDHSNLHPGGGLPAAPPTGFPTLVAFPNREAIPAMVPQFASDLLVLRDASSPSFWPWKDDDKAGLSCLYPVKALTPNKRAAINYTATITGRVVDATGSGVFGLNVYVLPAATNPPAGPALPAPGGPPTGTVSSCARLGGFSVTGASDTVTGSQGTGEFRLDGIPVPPIPGASTRYQVVVERLVGPGANAATAFGEWWWDMVMNPVLNNFALPGGVIQTATRGSLNSPLFPGLPLVPGTVQVDSIDLAMGSIVDLRIPIPGVPAAPPVLENVSRPRVEISPRIVTPTNGIVTITVTHNISANPVAPLAAIALTMNGVDVPVALTGPTTGGPVGTAPYVSTFTGTLPVPVPAGAVVRATALEALIPGSIPVATGVNEVRY